MSNALDKKEEIFWHGSRNENWIHILEKGLLIRPSSAIQTGSMFADGIYFADKAKKSFGYTSANNSYWARGSSDTAIMALYKVHVGNQYKIKHHTSECYKFSKKYLKDKGNYDSCWAIGGADLKNDEFVVYDISQATIFALVEFRG
jgi:poly [ADP-ribose] polymerase